MKARLATMRIPQQDVTRALILVRNLRIQAIREGLDPRATRIALLFGELCDRHFCEERLRPDEMRKLQEIAKEYFRVARRQKIE